jgi:hypothetical protein
MKSAVEDVAATVRGDAPRPREIDMVGIDDISG